MSSTERRRVLFWHAESDCYIEAFGEEEIDGWWASNDGLLSDVTGIEEHEGHAARMFRRETGQGSP